MKISSRFFREKRGSAIIDASIVYPLIVFVSIGLILVLIWTYTLLVSNAKMHIDLLQASGAQAKTFSLLNADEIMPGDGIADKEFCNMTIIDDKGFLSTKLYAHRSAFVRRLAHFNRTFDIHNDADANLLNEVEIIRCIAKTEDLGEVRH